MADSDEHEKLHSPYHDDEFPPVFPHRHSKSLTILDRQYPVVFKNTRKKWHQSQYRLRVLLSLQRSHVSGFSLSPFRE
jgi:hypothetical protein